MKRLWWLLRVAFHDWMWEGGEAPSLGQRLARHLPFYFSDPHWMSTKKVEALLARPGWEWTVGPPTTTASTGSATTIRYTQSPPR